jgi:hypothetical protein
MANGDFASQLAGAMEVAPARRDLLSKKPTDAYFPIFYTSALYAKSWPDPSPEDSNNIFNEMVNAVLSNNLSVADSIKDANAKMSLLLLK